MLLHVCRAGAIAASQQNLSAKRMATARKRVTVHQADNATALRHVANIVEQVEHVKNEVSLLSMIEHPAIVNM